MEIMKVKSTPKMLAMAAIVAAISSRGDTNSWYWPIPVDDLWLNVAAAPVIVVGHSPSGDPQDGLSNGFTGASLLVVDQVLKGECKSTAMSSPGWRDGTFGCAEMTNIFFLAPSPLPPAESVPAMDMLSFGPVPFSETARLIVSEEIERQRGDLKRFLSLVPESSVDGLAETRALVSKLEETRENADAVVSELTEWGLSHVQAVLFALAEYPVAKKPSKRELLSIRIPNGSLNGPIRESHRLYGAHSIPDVLSILADCGLGCGRFFWIYETNPGCADDEARQWFAGTFLLRWSSKKTLQGNWPVPAFLERIRIPPDIDVDTPQNKSDNNDSSLAP